MSLKELSTWLVPVAGLLAGCGGTGGTLGDEPAKPLANELGDGSKISQIVHAAPWFDPSNQQSVACAYPPQKKVYVTGVTITAIDRYDETSGGSIGTFYVQDTTLDPMPYSGIDVFSPSFSPPDLRFTPGDQADMLGVAEEFGGPTTFVFPECKSLPEFTGTLSFRVENGATAPKTISLADLQSYETARQWLGMLVRVENVKLSPGSADSKGRFTAPLQASGTGGDVASISNELYDVVGEAPKLNAQAGATFTSVTGIVTFFGSFHIAPRSPADFEP